jgi:hypothetical protein
MIVEYGQNIWDIALFNGIENAKDVVNYTTSWDSDCSDLWLTDIDLVEQKNLTVVQYGTKEIVKEYEWIKLQHQSPYDICLQLYANIESTVSICNSIGIGLDEFISDGYKFNRALEFVPVFVAEIDKKGYIFSTDLIDTVSVYSRYLTTELLEIITTELGERIIYE